MIMSAINRSLVELANYHILGRTLTTFAALSAVVEVLNGLGVAWAVNPRFSAACSGQVSEDPLNPRNCPSAQVCEEAGYGTRILHPLSLDRTPFEQTMTVFQLPDRVREVVDPIYEAFVLVFLMGYNRVTPRIGILLLPQSLEDLVIPEFRLVVSASPTIQKLRIPVPL